MVAGSIVRSEMAFGERFNLDRYPVRTSDLLSHLLHEHQAGFVNRVLEAGYSARAALHSEGALSDTETAALREKAKLLVRYILFADEAPLPAGGVKGDHEFMRDFAANRRLDGAGRSFKDFDLRTRLFKHRCSYMIYSPIVKKLPDVLLEMVRLELGKALSGSDAGFDYLPEEERQAIRSILAATGAL
jgi:hypothetical protein